MHDLVIIGAGQSGLAAARAAQGHRLETIVVEAGREPVGSWPRYYDSLTVFSPAAYSAMPEQPFPGDPDGYPHRDDVVAYLRRYAARLDVDIRTGVHVEHVEHVSGGVFLVRTATGAEIETRGLVAASGSFANPHVPSFPGQDTFTGEITHVADYTNPTPYAGKRVVVVGGGNSAIQVAHELTASARVTLASKEPIAFFPQRPQGRDIHYWLDRTGFDTLPPGWLARILPAHFVMDTDGYQAAIDSGRLERRPMFTGLVDDQVIWPDGARERVDAVILATGYRPNLAYLRTLGALHDDLPQHQEGLSTTHLGLAYVGLEFQRSFSSNTLRGVHRDADHVLPPLAAHIKDAARTIGLEHR